VAAARAIKVQQLSVGKLARTLELLRLRECRIEIGVAAGSFALRRGCCRTRAAASRIAGL
jgi:hypothetical protein